MKPPVAGLGAEVRGGAAVLGSAFCGTPFVSATSGFSPSGGTSGISRVRPSSATAAAGASSDKDGAVKFSGARFLLFIPCLVSGTAIQGLRARPEFAHRLQT